MPKEFKYDIELLIESVKHRPCLWNKNLEIYKDRIERRSAWEQIFGLLEEGYRDMTSEDQQFVGELILTKWTNIRDTFMKTLKTKARKPKKKYLYYNNLQFLLEVIPADEINVDFSEETSPNFFKTDDTESPEKRPKLKRKSRRNHAPKLEETEPTEAETSRQHSSDDDVDGLNLKPCDESNPRLMNEDEAFFASLLPTVVKYTIDERLEFRMEVLGIMKKINDNRKKWATEGKGGDGFLVNII